jgi:hypothetical protein
MRSKIFLIGFFLLVTASSGAVAIGLTASELGASGNQNTWEINNSTGENSSGNTSWKLVFSGQKIDDLTIGTVDPGSTRITYWNNSDKGYSLVVAGPGVKTEGKIYANFRDLIFSPDGTRLAYKALSNGRWLAVIDSSEGKKYDEIYSIVFSPDSKRVAYLADAGDKVAVVIDGEEKLYDNAYGLKFSPDSQHLAYYISKGGKGTFIVLDDKETEQLGANFVFSPDSTRWAYSSINAYVGDPVYIIMNNKTLDLGNDGAIYGLYFSPNSQRFAFDMRIGPSTYGSHRVVVDEVYGKEYPFPGVGKVVFSPDSRHVAYWAKSDGEGYFVVLDGIEGKNYSEVREPILFSPDSNHTAYAARSNDGWNVVVDGIEGNNYTDVWGLTFSPDGKHLAYAARASREGKDVQFVVADGKEGKQYIYDWTGQGIKYGPSFSPDGKLVYIANDGGKAEFIVVDQTRKIDPWIRLEGSALVFDSADTFHYLGWNETGSYLVTVNLTAQSETQGCSWTGIWDTDFGFMDLEQSGNNVTGISTGNIPYQRIQASVSDKKLVGNWSYSSNNDWGNFEFTMSDDCNSFTGNWRYGYTGTMDNSWNGTHA